MPLPNTSKPPQPRKTRSSTPRARTGCSTCRTRHVKCDETRPSCRKCIKAGWKCDGYPAQADTKSIPGNSSQSMTTTTSARPLNITAYSLPFRIPGSQKDRQMLHYFCVQGASDMSGFLSSDFWSRTVLRDSHQEPAVRQALVALSSLHLDYVTTDSPGADVAGEETLRDYGRAIRALQKRIANQGDDATKAVLICCVLFYCFESTVGNTEAAMKHLSNGLQVLASHQRTRSEVHDVGDMASLSDVFARLDLQATLFNDGRMPFLTLISNEEREQGIVHASENGAFSALHEAQRSLDKLQNWLSRLLTDTASYKGQASQTVPPHFLAEKKNMVTELNRWSQQFEAWQATNNATNEQTLCGIRILLINHQIFHMMLASVLPDDGRIFGCSPNPAAMEVIDRVEAILRSSQEQAAAARTATNPRRNFSSETGIIAPLFLLAVKCADESVCKRAGELLATCRRREGLYDASEMVEVLQRLGKIRAQRRSVYEQAGVVDTADRSLEYWAADLFSDMISGMDQIGKPKPTDAADA